MNGELISVVLPIYNVEKYLIRCLDRVTKQSYSNLEIILVDDGSLDNCSQICEEWAQKDDRVKVIHKENAGLGMARNTGIEVATGKYIYFIDSDDYIELDAIEKMYYAASLNQADMVLFGYKNVNGHGEIVNCVIPVSDKKVFVGTEVQEVFLPELIAHRKNELGMANFHMSAWACLYSLDLIKRVGWRFVSEREIIAEDVYSLLHLYKYVNKVVILSEALYCYCENETSLTHTYRKDRYEKIRYFHRQSIEASKRLRYVNEMERRLNEPYISFTIAAMKQIVDAKISRRERLEYLSYIIKDQYLEGVLKIVEPDSQSGNRRIFLRILRWKIVIGVYLVLKVRKS